MFIGMGHIFYSGRYGGSGVPNSIRGGVEHVLRRVYLLVFHILSISTVVNPSNDKRRWGHFGKHQEHRPRARSLEGEKKSGKREGKGNKEVREEIIMYI